MEAQALSYLRMLEGRTLQNSSAFSLLSKAFDSSLVGLANTWASKYLQYGDIPFPVDNAWSNDERLQSA
jgi:hypothetical protein